MVRITFHGAAGTVTGSKYLLEAGDARVLIDCGLFQGLKEHRVLNWETPPFSPDNIHAVALTHAHIDHTGYLPRLVKSGFHGKVFCTSGTKKLCRLLFLDLAKNQQRDAAYANRRGHSRHEPALPLFDLHDAKKALKRLRAIPREEWFCAKDPIWMRYHDAGHLLGSNLIEVEIRDRPDKTASMRLVFSGDVGRYDAPLYFDPVPPPPCDYLVCESTYGNRTHPDVDPLTELQRAVLAARERGGVMLVASFSVGRAQQLIYLLRVLMYQNRIPMTPVYLDSPMAVDATDIYCEFKGKHDLAEGHPPGKGCVLTGPNIHLVHTVAESKKLNQLTGPAIIISSSGMMTGGRILYHLKRRLSDPRNTILLGGFSVAGTRGRQLADGAKSLRIHGHNIPVHAATDRVVGLSGHADRNELLRWLADLPKPRRVFLTHGEPHGTAALAETLRHDKGWDVIAPKLGESFELE